MSALVRVGCVLTVCVGLFGCATTDVVEPVERGLSDAVASFLISPLTGRQQALSAVDRAKLEDAYDALVRRSDIAGASAVSEDLLSRLPGFAPAATLRAQASFAAERYGAAIETLTPIVLPLEDLLPPVGGSESDLDEPVATSARAAAWPAAEILYARSAEKADQIERAFDRYLVLADTSDSRMEAVRELARDGVSRLRSSAIARAHERFATAVEEQDESAAAAVLPVLQRWAADERATLEARERFAVAFDRPLIELEALRVLAPMEKGLGRYKRLARLEVDLGDVDRGLKLYEQMLEAYPRDPELIEGLASAQFRWRLTMLPEELTTIAGKDSITRGDFAELLYWLVPGVRSARPENGRIASDVPIEHPQREAVVRVVNLGLVAFADPTLRQFKPDEPVRRRDALASLLRLPAAMGLSAACTEGISSSGLSDDELCRTARGCRLLAEGEQCTQRREPLSGPEALEGLREILTLFDDPATAP